jgi:dolichyl-phosphate beta-glucosyltransferase
MTELSIVIPAYNEASRLPPCLVEINDYLSARLEDLQPAEIVVVDDGSRDDTVRRAAAIPGSENIDIRVLQHEQNRGKGAAVRTGFAAARGRWVLLSDADLAAPIPELEKLWSVRDEKSVIIGSRAIDRSLIAVRQPLYRDLMGRVFNLAVRMVAVGGIADTQCGFKLFPGPLARQLAAAQHLDGFAFDVELLLLAHRWGFSIREVGVRWRHVEASRVSALRHSTEMLVDVLLLGLRRLAGRLPPAPPAADGDSPGAGDA